MPTDSDKKKYKPITTGGGIFETIVFIVMGLIIFSAQNLNYDFSMNKPTIENAFDRNLKLQPNANKKLNFNNDQIKKIIGDRDKENLFLKSGKKELYEFCQKEGFNTDDKGLIECGLLINKRLIEANINPNEIDTSKETEEILNKLDEQNKLIKKLEKREKIRGVINVYKTYKKLGIF